MRNRAPTVNAQKKFAWNLVAAAPIGLGGAAFLTALAGLPLQSDLALLYRIISVFAVIIAVCVIAR